MSFVDRLNTDDSSGRLDQSVCSRSTPPHGSSTSCGGGSQQNCKRSRTTVSPRADTSDQGAVLIGCHSAVGETFFSLTADRAPCVVCGDFGTGYHYCVYTCDECKEFFRHTTEKNLLFECEREKKCVVDKFSCQKCPYCWFSRCLYVGMRKKDQYDQMSDGKLHCKRRRFESNENQQRSTMLKKDSSLSDEDEHLITQLVNAKPYLMPQDEVIFQDDKSGPELDMTVLLNFGYAELQLVTDWSRQVPGFCDLIIEDQISLLKSSFVEVCALRVAFRSLDCVDALRLTDSVSIRLANSDLVQAKCGGELIQAVIEFISRLRTIGIDKTEFSILCAIVLTYPDAAGVVDRTAVLALQSRLLRCLQRYSSSRYPSTPYRYGKILLRLPALRTISARLSDRFLSISLDDDVGMNAFAHRALNNDVAAESIVSG